MNIEHPGYESPFVKLFIEAGKKLGYRNNDPNGEYGLGKLEIAKIFFILFLLFTTPKEFTFVNSNNN